MENEPEIYSFLLLLRFSQPVSAPKRRTSLGNDGVLAHGTVAKRREDSPAAEKELHRMGRETTPRGNSHYYKLELLYKFLQ